MTVRHYVLLAVCGILAGCKPAAPPATTQAGATGIEVRLRSPQDAARSLVELLQAHLEALARHDHAAARRYRDQIVREVIARDNIMARFNTLSVRTAHGEAEVLPRLVESWASAVAYYAHGLDIEHMHVSPVPADSDKSVVEIPARGPGDTGRLEVLCVRGPDKEWRVFGIEFALPTAPRPTTRAVPSMPATQAATTSAPAAP